MIVISSLSIVATGILLLIMSCIQSSQPFLNQNILVINDIIKSKETKNSIVNVVDLGPTMYLIVKADPSNIPVSAIVKDPNGSIISSSTFSQDLVASFKPDMVGEYHLVLMNQGLIDINFNSILGYIPTFGENQRPNYDALVTIFLGAFLLVLGCFGFASGIFISVTNPSPSGLFKNIYAFLRSAGKKIIITCFRPDKVRLRRSSSAIRRDLIAERLSELDKQRNDFIVDVGLEKKHKLTED
jgi:hypothetical protein